MDKEVKEVWSSSVDETMIKDAGLSKSDVKRLIKELDNAVMETCLSFGVC